MAGNKDGFRYYNVDTERYQDMKVKRLKRQYRCDGIAVYDYILCETYRVKGYYLECDSNMIFDISDCFGIEENLVEEIINYCCSLGLFDKIMYVKKSIITSKSIQIRFTDMSKRAKRYSAKIREELSLIQEGKAEIPEKGVIIQEEVLETQEVSEVIYPPSILLKIDEVDAYLKNDIAWCEVISMQNPEIKSIEEVELLIEEFVSVLKQRGETEKSRKDSKSHFANWYLEKKRKVKTNGNNRRNLSTEVCHASEHL